MLIKRCASSIQVGCKVPASYMRLAAGLFFHGCYTEKNTKRWLLHFGVMFTHYTIPEPPGERMTREKIIFRE